MKNYLMWGWQFIKDGIVLGSVCYGVIFLVLLLKKDRRKFRIQNLYEILIAIWLITVLLITGVIPFHIDDIDFLNSTFHVSLLPFYGGAFVPMVLNVFMFIPIGFMLPLAFSKNMNYKKIALIGGGISLVIEMIQMFTGRYAEIDDLLLNSAGALLGYGCYEAGCCIRINKKKCIQKFCVLFVILLVSLGGLWSVCDHTNEKSDGISAVMNEIEKISFIHDSKKITGDIDSYEFRRFCEQLSNCGGHIFRIEDISDSDIINGNDYFIEIEFRKPQTISFQESRGFVITTTNKILYNLNSNRMFWGNDSYQKCVDYTYVDESLEEYKGQILSEYNELKNFIVNKYWK